MTESALTRAAETVFGWTILPGVVWGLKAANRRDDGRTIKTADIVGGLVDPLL